MASYTSLLLGVILCATTAHALHCYTCNLQSDNNNCLTATNCSHNETSCATNMISGAIAGISYMSITKTCIASCTSGSDSFAGFITSTSCCSTDLCNANSSTSTKPGCAAIILALGAILTILKSSAL
ncbi:lymphocyte antigen 6E-like [Engystomops pustulosus]|uniref:lymphocyte antigen 6E-like n=1 Tax=Engystomops pustulosus TaxID=76066 RepID=UPI003AFAF927